MHAPSSTPALRRTTLHIPRTYNSYNYWFVRWVLSDVVRLVVFPGMSGLEVVGLVAGIVSAFGSAGYLYRDWREQRKKRKTEAANKQLTELVKISGPRIQEEYDRDFRRLGQAFARGDGEQVLVFS